MKPKMLFVDDRARRIRAAFRQYGVEYHLTIAPNVVEALHALSSEEFNVVSLDHDLDGTEFQDPLAPQAAMEIIRYIEKTGWPGTKHKPEFWIHTYNGFAAQLMIGSLRTLGFAVESRTLRYPRYARGIVAGAFDIIHPGYIRLLQDAKRVCEYLIVALHEDPSLENPQKIKPILSVAERVEILSAIMYVDEVIPYKTEMDLDSLFQYADVRIVGSDHAGKSRRPYLGTKTYYHNRDHDWSSTRFKELIAAEIDYMEERMREK